jgi:hypothetical protein
MEYTVADEITIAVCNEKDIFSSTWRSLSCRRLEITYRTIWYNKALHLPRTYGNNPLHLPVLVLTDTKLG